jgi:hypothetical protein
MTRFVHDQFAKDLLEELLTPWGEVKPSRKIAAEVREIDVWFSPRPKTETPESTLGLLGRLATQPASFEPFRNAVDEHEICDCLLKLLVLRGEVVRQAKRERVPLETSVLPRLWVLTPTASESLLDRFSAKMDVEHWPAGIYFLSEAFRTAIVVIHQLPVTPETLWLRILGRGKVQQRAIDELEALPVNSRFRANALELLLNLRVILETRQNISQDDRELIMRLAPLYQQQLADATQQGIERGIEQGIEQGIQWGVRQGERLVIENLLRVRFGAIDDRLNAIIDPLLALAPEEFTPLLVNLSEDELIARFDHDRG